MDLMQMLPPIYDNNVSMQELQEILSEKITTLASDLNTLLDECFIATASRMLSRYEKIYDLKVDTSVSNEIRRERILAKARGIGTVTKQMIADTASAYSGGQVEVIEHPETNSFVVRFIGAYGIPENMNDLTITIEKIKPAHLSFTFEYTYRRWSEVAGYLWSEVASKTWYQLSTE
ncbi:MAG: hypothetical protein K0R34_2804 [Herbinix sp.]|jgi:uncharacterized protein YmfQ (DUF2313 family)|nr:hypothetical protein [Herbinix sp.]